MINPLYHFTRRVFGYISIAFIVVFAVLTLLFNKFIYYKLTYRRIAGKYYGFGYKDENNTELSEQQISSATVKHINQNLLEIEVDHSNSNEKFIWHGELRLNTKRYGRITYKYSKPERMSHRIGLKDCIISEDFRTVYLIDLDKENYGREVFKRK